jgi:hypothetical protein
VGNTGYHPVDVLAQNGRLFAGCNGYVYELNPATGAVLSHLLVTSWAGVGDYTTRLASDGQNLYIGVHSYVYCLPLNNWSATSWNVGVGGSGYNPVTVLFQGGQLFAGCNGYAYQITTTGQVAKSCLVSAKIGVGDYTTRLASDGQNLYVGAHGYVYGLPLAAPSWSAPAWNAGVGGVGYNRVTVFTQKGRLFAGSNGYVYEIATSNGAVLHTLLLGSMTGLGNYDTTLAGDGHSLYPGIHGYSYKIVTLYIAGIGPIGLVRASSNPDGSLQITALDEQNTLWHTIRAANGTWPYGWGNVQAAVPGTPIGPTRWADISADPSGNLDVLALDAQNTLWYTARNATNGIWSAWLNVQATMPSPSVGPTPTVAAANDGSGNLHVLTLDAQNTLWHTIQLPTGHWPYQWGNVQATMEGNGFPSIGPISSVAATTDPGGNLHLFVLDEAFQLWYTYRAANGTWPVPWTDVLEAVQPNISPLRVAGASANPNGDIQVAVVDANGTLWHTIHAAAGTWPYPWGNVQAVMAGSGSPEIGPTPFVAVSADPSGNLNVLALDEQDQAWYTYRASSGAWPAAWLGVEAPPAT